MYDVMKPEKKNMLIEKIIRGEWEMFQQVHEIDERSHCRDDWASFRIMRYSYYNAWSGPMLLSYIKDLDEAFTKNRNLVTEKYAYIMEYSDNDYYKKNLEPYLPKAGPEKIRLIDEIAKYLLDWEREFAIKYPNISRRSRPLEPGSNNKGESSVGGYLKGELKTYSELTLEHYLKHVKECKEKGINIPALVKEKMVTMSGFESLEDAESKN